MKSTESNKFYFKRSENEIKTFLKKLTLVSNGDKYDKVVKILGKPTYDKKLYGKESYAPLKARVLYYYMRIKDKGLVNELKDYYFRLEFNKDNILKEITSNQKYIKESKHLKEEAEKAKQKNTEKPIEDKRDTGSSIKVPVKFKY